MLEPVAPKWDDFFPAKNSHDRKYQAKFKFKEELRERAANRYRFQNRRFKREAKSTLILFWWNFQVPALKISFVPPKSSRESF